MDIAKEIEKEISLLTLALVKYSLCDEQNMPSKKSSSGGNIINIALGGKVSYSAAMKNIAYSDAYYEIESSNSYNIKMIDGGLMQLLYRINCENELISHRLAFYSSPTHETYQNDPELYENDPIYAEFLKKNIVPFPIRFDYNKEDEIHVEVDHPKSHLTLGQYESCRIPVTSPMGPADFIKFIMRNFYNSAYTKHSEISSYHSLCFDDTITVAESQVVHLSLGAQK